MYDIVTWDLRKLYIVIYNCKSSWDITWFNLLDIHFIFSLSVVSTLSINLICTLLVQSFQVHPTDGCWSKTRSSCFYITTDDGKMIVYDILQSIRHPIFELQLSHNKLNCIVPSEEEPVVAIGSYTGNVYLVEPGEFFTTFSRRDRSFFSEVGFQSLFE